MSLELPVITTPRLILRLPIHRDAATILNYYLENKEFLTAVEPTRPPLFYTLEFWQEQIEKGLIEYDHDQSFKLGVFTHSHPDRLVGKINFTQIQRGASYSCCLGYSLAEQEQGRGYMSEGLTAAIPHVLQNLNLHRITASYMPHNQRSGRLLKAQGFVIEGYARDYLMINGQWEDHILTSRINPNWL